MLSNEDKVDLGPFLMQFVMRNPFQIEQLQNQPTEAVSDLSIFRKKSSIETLSQKLNHNNSKIHIRDSNCSSHYHSSASEDGNTNACNIVQHLKVNFNTLGKIKIEQSDDSYSDQSNGEINFEQNKIFESLKKMNKDEKECIEEIGKCKSKGLKEKMAKRRTPYLVGRVLLARARSYKLERRLRKNLKSLSTLNCNYIFLKQHLTSFHQSFQHISNELLNSQLNI